MVSHGRGGSLRMGKEALARASTSLYLLGLPASSELWVGQRTAMDEIIPRLPQPLPPRWLHGFVLPLKGWAGREIQQSSWGWTWDGYSVRAQAQASSDPGQSRAGSSREGHILLRLAILEPQPSHPRIVSIRNV